MRDDEDSQELELSLSLELLVVMTKQPQFKEKVFSEIRNLDENDRIDSVRFCFDKALTDMPKSFTMPNDMDIVMVATLLGQHLGSLSSLEIAYIQLNQTQIGPRRCIWLTTVFLGCRQLRKLKYEVFESDSVTLVPLLAAMEGNEHLEDVTANLCFEDHAMDLLRPLATLSQLEVLDLSGVDIQTTEEAQAFGEVLRIASLTKADLGYFHIGTEDAMDIICDSTEASSLRTLQTYYWRYPPAKGAKVANALASSPIVHLSFDNESNSLAFYQTLDRCLWEGEKQNKSIQWLDVDPFDQPESTRVKNLTALLGRAHTWKLEQFVFSLRHAKKFDFLMQNFCSYVSKSDHLRRLTLSTDDIAVDKDFILSQPFIDAFGFGNGSLDEIEFNLSPRQLASGEAHWTGVMKKLVSTNLNRQRRLIGHLFEETQHAASESSRLGALSKALSAVDSHGRFAFLSGNEWRCRDALVTVTTPRSTSAFNNKRKGSHLTHDKTSKRPVSGVPDSLI